MFVLLAAGPRKYATFGRLISQGSLEGGEVVTDRLIELLDVLILGQATSFLVEAARDGRRLHYHCIHAPEHIREPVAVL